MIDVILIGAISNIAASMVGTLTIAVSTSGTIIDGMAAGIMTARIMTGVTANGVVDRYGTQKERQFRSFPISDSALLAMEGKGAGLGRSPRAYPLVTVMMVVAIVPVIPAMMPLGITVAMEGGIYAASNQNQCQSRS